MGQCAVGPLRHPTPQRDLDAHEGAPAQSDRCNYLIVAMLRCRCRSDRAAFCAARPAPQHGWWNRKWGVSDPARASHRGPEAAKRGRSRPSVCPLPGRFRVRSRPE
jgi:hypothetical protein